MKTYKPIITLSKNSRGIWDLDTSKGCHSGMNEGNNGCYGDCYSAHSAKIRGYNFSKTIERDFISLKHERQIIQQINKAGMSFIRIGCNGDPSENWQHTFKILQKIKRCNKEIVIITKHWQILPDEFTTMLNELKICINTSISALDSEEQIELRLNEYNRLKPFCKSILRIVSCDFNKKNKEGLHRSITQDELFKNENIIDTVFRPSKNNQFLLNGVINVSKSKFMNGIRLLSKFNRKTYIGNCGSCIEKCGIFNDKLRTKPVFEQQNLF